MTAVGLTLTASVLQSTGNDGEAALRETGSINRSLFTLGQVLAGLSMRKPSSRCRFHTMHFTLSTPALQCWCQL